MTKNGLTSKPPATFAEDRKKPAIRVSYWEPSFPSGRSLISRDGQRTRASLRKREIIDVRIDRCEAAGTISEKDITKCERIERFNSVPSRSEIEETFPDTTKPRKLEGKPQQKHQSAEVSGHRLRSLRLQSTGSCLCRCAAMGTL